MLLFFRKAADVFCFLRAVCILWKLKIPTWVRANFHLTQNAPNADLIS